MINPKIYTEICNIAPPRADKMDKIRMAAEHVASKIENGVTPVIICNKDFIRITEKVKLKNGSIKS